MDGKFWRSFLTLGIASILFIAAIAGAQALPAAAAAFHPQNSAHLIYTYTTLITVTSTADPDTSDSTTCATSPCTLRRAVIQARNLPLNQKPVLIAFNIPTSDSGYNSTLQLWKIQFSGISSASNAALRYLNGNIIIDGNTQTGGRATGPKIILVGPGTGLEDGIKMGESAGQNNNQIYNLGFQNFTTHLYINTTSNTVENNWFGLNDAGTAPYLRNNDPQDGSGSAGIAMAAGTTGAISNTVRNNYFLGFDGMAIAVRGRNNQVTDNWIGMTATGDTPNKQTDPSLICTPDDWLGGGGISVQDQDQWIENNRLAGLRQQIFEISQQPDAIRVTGTGHTIRLNQIGINGHATEVGVCGRGIYMSDGPKTTVILSNTIVNSRLSGISLNGALYDSNILRANIIKNDTAWTQVDGSLMAEDAIQVGKSLPDPLEVFKPAKITSISGTIVSGSANSACPNCIIELFLDDTDAVTETLQSLGTVQSNASGDWTTTLPFTLTGHQGIRTTSTSTQYNAIPGRSSNTTTGLSELYRSRYLVYLPLIVRP